MAGASRLVFAVLLALGSGGAQTATFGVTVVDTTGLEGKIYHIAWDSQKLPSFKKMKPKGTIYTTQLNIPPRHFTEGFPGITKRFEWFAIDYSGRFWIAQPGIYTFALASDDGSKLYIDDQLVIDNDGIHSITRLTRSVNLPQGVHSIRVSYFQGPRDELALILEIAPPNQQFRVFSTRDFRPPAE